MSSEASPNPSAPPKETTAAPAPPTGDETTVSAQAEEDTVFALPTPPALVSYTDQTRVAGFVAAHRLDGYVSAAVRLARSCFTGARGITLDMSGEPGEYGEGVCLTVRTGAGADESLRQYHAFVARWVESTPPWVADLVGISTDLR